MPTNKSVGKENELYIHSAVLLFHKKEWNYVICSKMFWLELSYRAKIINIWKDKYYVFSYMQNLHFRKENMKVEKNLFMDDKELRRRVDGAKTKWKRGQCAQSTQFMRVNIMLKFIIFHK